MMGSKVIAAKQIEVGDEIEVSGSPFNGKGIVKEIDNGVAKIEMGKITFYKEVSEIEIK